MKYMTSLFRCRSCGVIYETFYPVDDSCKDCKSGPIRMLEVIKKHKFDNLLVGIFKEGEDIFGVIKASSLPYEEVSTETAECIIKVNLNLLGEYPA